MPNQTIPDGVWPTMITPYTDQGAIDYRALEALIDWYIARGVAGLFAVCQSSEMFHLSLRERLDLARACVRLSGGPVALITNRLAGHAEGDDVFVGRLERILSALPDDVPLGPGSLLDDREPVLPGERDVRARDRRRARPTCLTIAEPVTLQPCESS